MRQAKSKQTAKSRQSKAEADARLEQTKAAAAALTRAYKFGNGFLATWLVTAAVGSGYEFGPHSRHRVDYVNTNEYVGMAQHLSAQSGLSIPLHVVNRLDNILFLRRQVRDLHVRIRQMNPLDPGVNSKSDAGHQAFIDTLARVRIELKSDTTTSETSIPTPASGTLGLEGLELSPKVSEKEDSSFWQAMEDDKVQARFALQDLFSTLKSLEQEALRLWEAFHNGRSESQLVIAATTTYMAMKLVTALELEFTELYENCDLGLLAQELHVEACKEQGQPNLQGFVIDFDHYTTAESYYIPHLWMATLLHSNWSQVVQDVQNKKAVSRSFDNDERKIFNSPASGRLNDEGKENKGRCEESLEFGYRTIHRVLSSLSIAKTIEKLYEDLYPAEMDPLIQMIAERHTQPLAFAFAMRLQEKITLTVRTESVPVCETARQKMNGVIDAKMKHLSLNEKDFEGANGIEIWKKLYEIFNGCGGLLHETIQPENDRGKMRCRMFQEFPIISGVSLADYKCCYNIGSIPAIMHQQCANDAAHLYIMVRWYQRSGAAKPIAAVEWPEMEKFLQMHASQLFGARTGSELRTFSDRWMFHLTCCGVSVSWMKDLTNRRIRDRPALSQSRMRRARRIVPIMRHFWLKHINWRNGVSLEGLSRILQDKHVPDEHWAKMVEAEMGVDSKEGKVPDIVKAGNNEKASAFDARDPEEPGEDVPLAIELLRAFRDEIEKEERATHFDYLSFHDQCYKYLSDIRDRLSQPDLFPHQKPDGSFTTPFREGYMGVLCVANAVFDILDHHAGKNLNFELDAWFDELHKATAGASQKESSQEELRAVQTEEKDETKDKGQAEGKEQKDKDQKEKEKKDRKNKNARRREKKKLEKQGAGEAAGPEKAAEPDEEEEERSVKDYIS